MFKTLISLFRKIFFGNAVVFSPASKIRGYESSGFTDQQGYGPRRYQK